MLGLVQETGYKKSNIPFWPQGAPRPAGATDSRAGKESPVTDTVMGECRRGESLVEMGPDPIVGGLSQREKYLPKSILSIP